MLEPRRENPGNGGGIQHRRCVYKDGYIHLLYRASDRDFAALRDELPRGDKRFCSVIGLAKADGISFERQPEPVLPVRALKRHGVWKTRG